MQVADMLSKLKNAITRSKWLLGAFAGIIAITGNDIYKDDIAAKRMIITYSIFGIAIFAFAIVKFEKVLFDINGKLQSHALKKSHPLPNDIKWPEYADFLYTIGTLLLAITGGFLIYITLGEPIYLLYALLLILAVLILISIIYMICKKKKPDDNG